MILLLFTIILVNIASSLKFGQYEIIIQTGDQYWSGTDANVYIELYGDKDSSIGKVLLNSKPEDFNIGRLDTFLVDIGTDVGEITKLKIGHDNSGSSPGWYVEEVLVRTSGGKFFKFVVGWIGGNYPTDRIVEPSFHSICGNIPKARIVNGKDALPNSWPWQVQIRLLNTAKTNQCSGTLIHPQYVLTAGHCVDSLFISKKSYKITLGEHDITGDDHTEQVREIEAIIIHPRWQRVTFDSDIALIKLKKPVILNKEVNIACLPKQGFQQEKDHKCMITGWGRLSGSGGKQPTILQQASITTRNNDVCSTEHAHITNNNLCAGGNDATSVCKGDSGGPLVCPDNHGIFYLQGITSRGRMTCHVGLTSVYTRVANYIDWINSKIE